MSIHDMVTYRDPDTPGMAFGRPPTRPGYRRDVTAGPATRGVAPSAVRASAGADAPSADGTFAGAHEASADGTFAGAHGTHAVAASDGADPVGPPEGGGLLDRPESETEVHRAETEAGRPAAEVDRPEAETEVDRPESETAIDPPEAETAIDPPEAEIDEPETGIDPAGPDVVDPVVASTTAEAVDGPDGVAPVQDGREPALGPDRVADLRRRWGAVQAGFVDDPRRAVEVADDIVAEAVSALQAAIDDRRRAVAAPWRDDAGASTDALLAAFHAYRAVFDRVLSA
jgi:hypothetical protein